MLNTRSQRLPRTLVMGLVIALMAVAGAVWAKSSFSTSSHLFDPTTGYRTKDFRAPITAPLVGGKAITLDELEVLMAEKQPVLVDVMFIDHGLKSILTFGYLGENPHREHIPGSVWLPLMGQATLSRDTESHYRSALSHLTKGNLAAPVVFYCLSDCWASWNAARRAISFGYSNVLWFKEGTDLWRDAGLPLEKAVILADKQPQ